MTHKFTTYSLWWQFGLLTRMNWLYLCMSVCVSILHVYMHISNKHSEKNQGQKSHSQLPQNKYNKDPRIKLTQKVKSFYNKNYKALKKEIEENIRLERPHGLEELISWKWLYYQKQVSDSIQSLSKSQYYFSQKQKKKFKYLWKYKAPMVVKPIPEQKECCCRYHYIWFQDILQIHSYKTSMMPA